MQHFGLSLFANLNLDLELRNAIHPSLDIDYRYDRGFIMGYAFTIGSGGRSTKKDRRKQSGTKTAGSQVSFGAAVKSMNRQGISKSFDLFGLELLNTINSGSKDNIDEIRRSLGYSYGTGYGADAGVEFSTSSNYSQINTGFSMMDIFDTTFRKLEGTGKIPKQDMTMNWGVSFNQDFWIIDYTLSADVHPINAPIDFKRKLHFGFELAYLSFV
jgi:hypothetical protein